MHLKYFQQYNGHVLKLLPILYLTCTLNTTNSTDDMHLKYYQQQTGYLLQILPTMHRI